MVLDSLTKPPYEPFEKASILDLSKKTAFLLALASAKRVGEIHAFSSEIKHTEKWTAVTISTLPHFVAKNQDPSKDDPRFGPFAIPALPWEDNGNCPRQDLSQTNQEDKIQVSKVIPASTSSWHSGRQEYHLLLDQRRH